MNLREPYAATAFAGLGWSEISERPIDRVAAAGLADSLGVSLWKAKYQGSSGAAIRASAQLDKKKLGWLVYNCPAYRAAYSALAARIAREGNIADPDFPQMRLVGDIASKTFRWFQYKGQAWASTGTMLADLAQINTDALAVLQWIVANVPNYGTYATLSVSIDETFTSLTTTETPSVVALDPTLLSQVQALASRFSGMP